MATKSTAEAKGQSSEEQTVPVLEDDNHERKTPWIRYQIEYRHHFTLELLHREETREKKTMLWKSAEDNEPAFELITVFTARDMESGGRTNGTTTSMQVTPSPPSHHIRILSSAIINALQTVVKYYPFQNLTGGVINVRWPYPILVHHYDNLAAFRENLIGKDEESLCIRERNAVGDLGLLLAFLDEHIMPDVRAEQERNKRGFYTFEYMWVPMKPGATMLHTPKAESHSEAGVVHSMTGGTFGPRDSALPWTQRLWGLRFDGKCLGRVSTTLYHDRFDGEISLRNSTLWLVMTEADQMDEEDFEGSHVNQPVAAQIEHGEEYFNLLHKQCKHYKGRSADFPFNMIDTLVMSDLSTYFADHSAEIPEFMDTTDIRNWNSDCICEVCESKRDATVSKTTTKEFTSLFDHYDLIDIERQTELSQHQYILCPPQIKAFNFRTRIWENLHVANFHDPNYDEGMINNLVMNEGRKQMLKALAKSFTRQNRYGEVVTGDMWTADFVKGKGSGLIFLLHGRPGVGKTCTAECIAAFTQRPLMILTPSDIGATIDDVEKNLTKGFKTARSWGAVLLIDEADVFMERRTAADLHRNALVAAFLRALESYDGILFLTTNRVGGFDDAFISRVHIQLYYPDFTDQDRQEVWKTFIDKLARERSRTMRLNLSAKEYIRGAEMRAIKWNGREIRNAFQTAVALAEYDAEKDEEGKIVVTDTHFRSVVELSKDFKDYLRELHRGDEAKRAERFFERLDNFSTAEGHK